MTTLDRGFRMDMGVFVASLVMLGFGVVLVYSSSFAVAQDRFGGADFFLERHAVRAIIALVCFLVFMNVDYHVWSRFSGVAFALSLVLLVMVLVIPGHAVNGAKRWLSIGPVTFQVSELACMALILTLARRCDNLGNDIQQWKPLLKSIALILVVAVLVLIEPNFSTAFMITMVGLSILFLSGARFAHMGGLFLAALPVIVIGLLAAPYRRARVMHFLSGSGESSGIGYQAYQALVGLGNGGFFGVGLGQGKAKLFYLPEPHTDFVFAILGEEIGFAGLIVVFAIFGFLVVRGFRIAMNAPDKQGQLMAFGFTMMLAVYVIVHSCVNVGLLPTTGVPLPFLSYGGMSLVFTMSTIGILLNISSQANRATAQAVVAQKERLAKFQR